MKMSSRFIPALLSLAVVPMAFPGGASAQKASGPQAFATYITAEQWHAVGALPGVDRQIVSRDIGDLNLSVGIIHRGAVGGPPPDGAAAGGRAGGGGGGGAAPPPPDCGVTSGAASGASGIKHDFQTETYIVVSGAGTLVTGGDILNGRQSTPESSVTTTLNGPSCSGQIVGDWVARYVTEGDVVIIPAGTPHGWLNIPDHVDYMSVRPDPQRVLSDHYVNPQLEGAVPEIKVTP
jgi:hypothetical protein